MQLHKSTISLLMWSNSRLTFTFNAGLFSLNLWRFSLTQWRRKKSVMILWSPSGRNRHDCVWYFINLGLWLCVTLHVHIYMQFPGSFLLKSPFYMSCWCFGPQGCHPSLPPSFCYSLLSSESEWRLPGSWGQQCLSARVFAGRRPAHGHAGHVRQPVHAEGLGHCVCTQHHDQLHAGALILILNLPLQQSRYSDANKCLWSPGQQYNLTLNKTNSFMVFACVCLKNIPYIILLTYWRI